MHERFNQRGKGNMLGITVGDILYVKRIIGYVIDQPILLCKKKKERKMKWNYKASQLKLLKEKQVSLRLRYLRRFTK